MRALALLAALVSVGCIAPAETAPTPETTRAPEAWRACVTTAGPCVDPVFCDELGASEDDRCNDLADGRCLAFPVPQGAACFPTADITTGSCDGAGTCARY